MFQAKWSPADSLHGVSLSEANAWIRAIDLSARRIHLNGPDQQTDARLFLLALRQLLKAAALAADAVNGSQEAASLHAARHLFDSAVPGAKDACDMLEHFREYAKGTGNLQSAAPQRKRQGDREAAACDWPLGYDNATDVIQVGQHQIEVTRACEQAKLLRSAIWEAVRHG